MLVRKITRIFLTLVVVFAQVAPAPLLADLLRLRVGQEANLRDDDAPNQVVGRLKSGSIVEIDVPHDKIKRDSKGVLDLERTLKAWLSSPVEYKDGRYDYFYPVKVRTAAKGSQVPRGHPKVLIALNHLTQPQKAGTPAEPRVELRTSGNAELVATPPARAEQPQVSPRRIRGLFEYILRQESPAPTQQARTQRAQEAAPPQTTRYRSRESVGVIQVERGGSTTLLASNTTPGPFAKTYSNVDRTVEWRTKATFAAMESGELYSDCGLSMNEFMPELETQAKRIGMPPVLLKAMMYTESDGSCSVTRQEDNGTKSIGAFQISSSRGRECTSAEETWIRRTHSLETMRAKGPACLGNPVFAVRKATQMLKEKLDYLREHGYPAIDRHPVTKWAITIAAYNGGEWWLQQAAMLSDDYRDNEDGRVYDHYSWEDLKRLLLRGKLSGADFTSLFPEAARGRRGKGEDNVAHVEIVFATAEHGGIARPHFVPEMFARPAAEHEHDAGSAS